MRQLCSACQIEAGQLAQPPHLSQICTAKPFLCMIFNSFESTPAGSHICAEKQPKQCCGSRHVDHAQDNPSKVVGTAEESEGVAHHVGHAKATVDELQECTSAKPHHASRIISTIGFVLALNTQSSSTYSKQICFRSIWAFLHLLRQHHT